MYVVDCQDEFAKTFIVAANFFSDYNNCMVLV